MGGDRLKKSLEDLFQDQDTQAVPCPELEKDLLLRYRQTHSSGKRWYSMLKLQTRFARMAVAGLAVLLLGLGACTTETSTEVEVGKQLRIDLAGHLQGARGMKTIDLNQRIQKVVQDFSAAPGVENVNVNLDQNGEGDLALSLVLMGDNLDRETLTTLVRKNFPELPDADIQVQSLEGSLTESWAHRLGREVFHLDADGQSVEEIRAQVFQQLADQGFQGDAEVKVTAGDGRQTIEIELTEEEDGSQ